MDKKDKIISAAEKVIRNTTALIIGTILNKICSLFFFILVAKYFGDIGLGKYSFAISFTALFMVLGDIGLSTFAIKEVAKNKNLASKYLGNIAILKTILSFITLGIIFIAINILNYPLETRQVVYLIGISVFFNSISMSLRWIFQAFQKMEYEALINLAQGMLLFGFGLLALYIGSGLMGLAFAHLFTNIVIFYLSFTITNKIFVKPIFKIDWNFWKYLIKFAYPMGLMAIFSIVYLNADTIMLSLIKGDAHVGWYNAGYKLMGVLRMIFSLFVVALFPVMANSYKSSKESLEKILKKAMQYSLLLVLPIGIAGVILSDRIIMLIWGEVFSQAVLSFQILIWAGILCLFAMMGGHCLIAIDKPKISTYITAVAMITNIILNLLLIPKFSHIGASISITVTEFMVAVIAFFYVCKNLKISLFFKEDFKILTASLLTGGFIWYLRDYNLYLSIVLFACLYIIILIRSKAVTGEDLRLLKQIFSYQKPI